MIKNLLSRFKYMLVLFLLGSVAGCSTPMTISGAPAVAQFDVFSVVGTDKTIIDHLVSYTSGKDCSFVYVEKGNRYCKEDEPVIKPQVYCYSTLGRATCYETPDPFANGQRESGNNDHNLVTSHKSRSVPF